jgi:hypothetical protein
MDLVVPPMDGYEIMVLHMQSNHEPLYLEIIP